MTVLKSTRLKAVLDKARNAGQVEETVSIAGLNLVLSSLPAASYSAILEELKDVSEHNYATEYQIEHVCRSIVEIDGQSFRDVGFIEVDGESGAPPIKVERHQWLRENLVATWSREFVQVAFRKVLDAIQLAEDKANVGVKFKVEAETDEEKYRRILGELRDAGAELPGDMRQAILKEEGLVVATSKAELDALDERARTWPQPDEEKASDEAQRPVEPAVASAAEPTAGDPSAAPTVVPHTAPRAPQQLVQAASAPDQDADALDSVASQERAGAPAVRVPLNQTPIRDPVPSYTEQSVASGNRRGPAPPPDQVHDLSSRAERFAAIESLEGDDDVVVLQHQAKLDPAGAGSIMDKPPSVGINSKYVSPTGLNPRAARR